MSEISKAILPHACAVELHDVSKSYAIWSSPSKQLTTPLWYKLGIKTAPEEGRIFTAVKKMDLRIDEGECLGILGRNGAGKSSLLQLIAGTLHPTTGSVKTSGRIAALLELGSGFNPDFTGRENVYLNATILGMSKSDIEERYEQIVDYSGIREFIDQPVKTYSSGMTLRLAFSVCAHVDADILIVDEALAVGDARFSLKCFATLNQFIQSGKTVIFVSHDTNSVKNLCNRAILLERGELLYEGDPNDVVNVYSKLIASPEGIDSVREDIAKLRAGGKLPESGSGAKASSVLANQEEEDQIHAKEALRLLVEERSHQQLTDKEYAYGGERGEIESALVCDEQGEPRLNFDSGSLAKIHIVCAAFKEIPSPIYAVTIKDHRGQEVYGTNTYFRNETWPTVRAGEKTHVTISIQLNLIPGVYFISLGWVELDEGEVDVVQRRYDVIRLEMTARDQAFGIAYCATSIEVEPA